MTHFLVEYKDKIIGSYDNYNTAETFILSCLQNNLMQNQAKILKFRADSCYCEEEHMVFSKEMLSKEMLSKQKNIIKPELFQEKDIIKPEKNIVDHTDPKVIEISKQKLELQHKINMLKVHKQRVEESKKIYENDLKLFDLFTENKKKDPDFIMSDLFVQKYNIIKQLKDEGKLSWDNFIKLHKQENYYGDYFGINSYEESYVDNNNDLSEEMEIESDSDTDVSEV